MMEWSFQLCLFIKEPVFTIYVMVSVFGGGGGGGGGASFSIKFAPQQLTLREAEK